MQKRSHLSAGSIQSPQLLLLSGIGPKKHLQRHRIRAIQESAVGHNLQDHVGIPLFVQFKRSNPVTETLNDLKLAAAALAVNNTGPLIGIGATNTVAFVNTLNNSRYPDIQHIYFQFDKNSSSMGVFLMFLELNENFSQEILRENKEVQIGGAIVLVLNPKSRGQI